MKRILLVLFLISLVHFGSGAGWIGIHTGVPQPATKTLIFSSGDVSLIRFSLDGFLTQEVTTPRGPALTIALEDATPMLIQGTPELPKLTASVIIPDLAAMQVEVVSASYRDYENVLVAPSKGNLTRDIDPSTVPYEFGSVYNQDAFYPGTLTGMRDPHIIRDFRGQTVIVYPFQYNPVTRILRVYDEITVKVSKTGDDGINPIIRDQQPESLDVSFKSIYDRHFLNYENTLRYEPLEEYGNLLIIAYNAFIPAMQPYIQWKKQIGYPVEMVDVATIGNSTAIKAFIANYYNTKGLTFVLLVGDNAQVPTSSTSAGDSDNAYTYIVGNDHYPDLFIGRFSAENTDQVTTQVTRTINYEQNPLMTLDWFTKAIGIASDQGPGDDGEMDYEHIRNINTDLLGFTYTYAYELFDGSQGGNDAPGNPTPAQVAEAVNGGSTIINYTGHGSQTSWGTSGFSNSDVNNLVNDNMLPFIWSVACVNGDFANATCFAEAWLRATHNGQPTGAVAFFGATINQSWNPPMAAIDEMNDILVESYDFYNRTYGALSMHGCMLMNDEYGAGGDEMTDTWTIFGDPSLMVRTAVPVTMTVTHDPILFVGATEMTIYCDADGARATLSQDGTTLSTGIADNGMVMLSFAQLSEPGTVTLTITSFNYLPYITEIDVIPPSGPYVVMEAYDVNDPTGNNNGLPDYNESIGLGMEMENVGVEDAIDVTVTLSSSDPYIEITDAEEIYDLIPAGGTTMIQDAFTFDIPSDIPDQHSIVFQLTSTDGESTWQSTFMMKANAPVLSINTLTINDETGGNGDGEPDPGESVTMTINYTNTGHAVAYDVDVMLEGQSAFVDILNPMQNFASIGFLGVFNKTFDVIVDENSPEGIIVNFRNELTMGNLTLEKTTPVRISAMCEDFETNDFEKFDWVLGGTQPWTITSQYPFEGIFSAKSGLITHDQTSEISVDYNVMQADSIIFYRKVSSEPSDLLKFYIDGSLAGQWSGTSSGWKREAFAVGAGPREFKWVYVKNNLGSSGSDCAWLDEIYFPSPNVLTLWAGPDDAVCIGNTYALAQSYGTCYTSVQWTSDGGGTFDDNSIMNPVYTPGGDDLNGDQVVLSLTLFDGTGFSVSDGMILSFISVPEAPALPDGPTTVDVFEVQNSQYTIAEVPGAEDYLWNLSPAEAGSIAGSGLTGHVSWNPEFIGTAYVSATGVNSCGDGQPSPELTVTVINSSVGTGELTPQASMLLIYPNPVNIQFFIQSRVTLENVDVRIYDLLGSQVLVMPGITLKGGAPVMVEVNGLPDGLYILSLKSKDFFKETKLIIH